jgi:hypothetical protein
VRFAAVVGAVRDGFSGWQAGVTGITRRLRPGHALVEGEDHGLGAGALGARITTVGIGAGGVEGGGRTRSHASGARRGRDPR